MIPWLCLTAMMLGATSDVPETPDFEEPDEVKNLPLAPGELAPDWDLLGWSDHQERELTDYRGKVVVIDFWGIWCGPCRQQIPVLKELEHKYQDVVFLAIHTAGSDPKAIMETLTQEEWSIPTGFDRGDNIQSGRTTQRFGIIGFPSLVIIGHDGRVAYNSSRGMLSKNLEKTLGEYEEICKELHIAWPVTAENYESVEGMTSDLNRLANALYSRKIDHAIENLSKDSREPPTEGQ